MKLFISGQKEEFSARTVRPSVDQIRRFLDASKEGELFLPVQLAEMVKVNHTTIYKNRVDLPGYWHNVGKKQYWGKPDTIKQLVKETSK